MKAAFTTAGEKVHDLRQRVEAEIQATTEREILEDVLDLASARGAAFDKTIAPILEAAARTDERLSRLSGTKQAIRTEYTLSTAPIVQAWLIAELQKIVAGKGVFERFDAARPGVTAASSIQGPTVIERVVSTGKRPKTEQRFAFESLEVFANWSVLRLREWQRDKVTELRRCKLELCLRFFFVKRSGGKPRRGYCCAEHMAEAHKRTGSARVLAHRAGVSLAEFQKTRRHK